uniref:PX domain-containing protein n=1 Tax=Electrophorus electricus TaxID=8005 RepID=A0A4W4EYC0_ELEEL
FSEMDFVASPEQNIDKNVCIVGSELVENYTVYIIEMKVGDHRWTTKHRYSDFYDLHEKLTSQKKIDKHLLPPKKIIGKNSKSLVEKRQKELEVYLQTLLSRFPVTAPKVLSIFLHFHLYEINGITATLAEDLFHRGEQLLVAGEVFVLRPLQLYAITQQLKIAKPTCANGDAKTDLGHILDFACRLKYLKVPGTKGFVGTSNIEEQTLPFDLSVFKSLLQIEISDCISGQLKGLPLLKPSLATLSIHHSAASMKEILVPEAAEFAQWEPEGVDIDRSVTAIIPTWQMLTTLDMSCNSICYIDESVKLIPEVEFLDLSHNELSLVENLQHLYNLVHLDLSYNKLTVLEGVHTKLGNIKTLNLAGNQLETLCGLSKLYSLVNLDLSSNRLAQLDEIKHIGTLPCLEKLSLASNPVCIIPDYRTRVLAQIQITTLCLFGVVVSLDGTVTTEKELDTVEVLKAIQKAKEAKDRMANNEKKVTGIHIVVWSYISFHGIHDVPKQAEGGPKSSSSSCSLAAPPSSSPPLSCSVSSSQGNHVCIRLLGGGTCSFDQESCTNSLFTPVLPFCYVSYTTTNLDFITQLSALICQADRDRKTSRQTRTTCLGMNDQGSPDSGGSYFEMGLDTSNEIMGCLSASTVQDKELEDTERGNVHINMIMWSHCITLGPDIGLSQKLSCLVATDCFLVVFHTCSKELPSSIQELMDSLEIGLMVPYSDIESFQFDIPDTCVSLKVRFCEAQWYFFSDGQNLKELHRHVDLLVEKTNSEHMTGPSNIQLFIQQFLNSWEVEEHCGVKSGYLAHVLNHATLFTSRQDITKKPRQCSIPPDVLSSLHENQTFIPLILFLTPRHLCVLKVDFVALGSNAITEGNHLRSWSRLNRIPLASILLNPKHGCTGQSNAITHHFCDDHVLELMAGHEYLVVVFALPNDKFLFLRQFSQFRATLRDIKTIAVWQTSKCHLKVKSMSQRKTSVTTFSEHNYRCLLSTLLAVFLLILFFSISVPQEMQKPHLALSLLYPGETLLQQLSEQNQCPSHLFLSASLHYLSSLRGEELIHFFHDNIAEVENEELKHILWTSVLFYKSPDVELTACVMLSTKTVYFILNDVASTLSDQHKATDFLISFCFAMKLNELQTVNVGLFDQYFRVVGPSAEHIISCLTRDSYSTHHFLQHLMTVLSLLEKVPSPEPSDQDFYTQFGKKSTGKMENYELVHSSKVKFVYPSEEEIGDLTFIVAERKGPQGSSHSFNILFYVLVFQVQSPSIGHSAEKQHLLYAKTLVLTSTDIFLLDEDYISYPLPEFAKEPPQRDKYRLTDARRIRDLDRVLMGYQTYPQALTLVFDDVPGPDLLCHLTMDHFADKLERGERTQTNGGAESEVQWCIFVPSADSRERLISLLARQWEALCSRELPVELTG